MAKNKTTTTDADVFEFIDAFADTAQKKEDSLKLVQLMQEWSGYEPKMYGPSIIGFGNYHYKYASGHEGDAPLIGFSPRKNAISLYVFCPVEEQKQLLQDLGKYKMGKSCIYAKKLSDINLITLEKLCKATIVFLQQQYQDSCMC